MALARRSVGFVAVALVVACGESYGGAVLGAPDASPADASVETSTAFDAAPPTDGDAGTGFCAAHPTATLCYDFDDGRSIATLFPESVLSTPTATSTIGPDGFSPASSLLLEWPGGAFDNNTTLLENVHTRSLVAKYQTSLHVELRLRVKGGADTSYTRMLNVAFPRNGDDAVVLEMNVRSGGAQFGTELIPVNGGASTFDFRTVTEPLQMWSLVAIDVAGSPPTVKLTIDGKPAITPFVVDAKFLAGVAPKISLSMQHYAEASLVSTVFGFDDVLVDVK